MALFDSATSLFDPVAAPLAGARPSAVVCPSGARGPARSWDGAHPAAVCANMSHRSGAAGVMVVERSLRVPWLSPNPVGGNKIGVLPAR